MNSVAAAREIYHGHALVAQIAVLQKPAVEFDLEGPLGAAEAHAALRNGIAHGTGKRDADVVAEFRHCGQVVHEVRIVGEGRLLAVGIAP